MSDDGINADPLQSGSGATRWWLIALIVLLVGGAVLLAFLLFSNDDGSESSDTTLASTTTVDTSTTLPPETTQAPETTTAPETTQAPETTAAPETTDAPETTQAPETTTTPETTQAPQTELEFTIVDIDDGGTVPIGFTCDGANTPPIVNIETIPDGTRQFAMIVDDPDAPGADPFVHWVVYAIPEGTAQITDGVAEFTYGMNDVGGSEWFGPCPPPGDGPHHYVFTLYALDEALDLGPDLDGRALFATIEGSIITETTITATYERAAG